MTYKGPRILLRTTRTFSQRYADSRQRSLVERRGSWCEVVAVWTAQQQNCDKSSCSQLCQQMVNVEGGSLGFGEYLELQNLGQVGSLWKLHIGLPPGTILETGPETKTRMSEGALSSETQGPPRAPHAVLLERPTQGTLHLCAASANLYTRKGVSVVEKRTSYYHP